MSKEASNSKSTSIKIDASLLERLQEYRTLSGVTASHCINEALRDYLDVVVAARMDVFRPRKRVSQGEKPAARAAAKKRVAA